MRLAIAQSNIGFKLNMGWGRPNAGKDSNPGLHAPQQTPTLPPTTAFVLLENRALFIAFISTGQ